MQSRCFVFSICVQYTTGLKCLLMNFGKALGEGKRERQQKKIAKTVIPFEKYTGRQAFGFVKEALFLQKKEAIMWCIKVPK